MEGIKDFLNRVWGEALVSERAALVAVGGFLVVDVLTGQIIMALVDAAALAVLAWLIVETD